MNGINSKKIKVNFFDKNILFILQFYLINICFLKIDVYKNDQGIVNKKKAENIGIIRINTEENISRVDIKKEPNINKADKLSIDGAI